MSKALIALSIAWPMVLAGATYARIRHAAPWLTAAVYLTGGRICHQRPERSFESDGVQWPVCGRCGGLYLAAPIGAVLAGVRRRRSSSQSRDRIWLAIACLPTAATFVAEYAGLVAVSSLARFLAALPLGAAVSWAIVRAASEPAAAHRVD